ncbi:Maf family protein [Bacillus sp. FJAT-44742]|uniref:Maf family protein n=1 Tax=Bacillus sp. FJAT-44742 TaxID=2014005 RepID=UPI000C243535|nr:Maf family protein [Bacillus sp. FJAT-44742]
MNSLILASGSPRRKELLSTLGFSFTVVKSNIPEEIIPGNSPASTVERLAVHKAKHVAKDFPESVVIGADTVVVFNNTILGKPKSEKEARTMLADLSDATHHVYTGVSIISPEQTFSFHQKTDVTFYPLRSEEIESYVKTKDPFDKAGSYGIQGIGSFLVKEIHGDYFNVVGLPVARLVRELRKYDVYPYFNN